jgi:hypothetical protein
LIKYNLEDRKGSRRQTMAEKKYKPFGIMRIKKMDDLRAIYAKRRRNFTAADLAQYADDGPTFPVKGLLKELAAIHRSEERKRRAKKAP